MGGFADVRRYGGAIWGDATSINCTFTGNHAGYGGAMWSDNAYNCTFINNTAKRQNDDNSGRGGAGYKITAGNCTFINNDGYEGGALYDSFAVNSYFKDNHVKYATTDSAMNGGIAANCTFTNNTYKNTVITKKFEIDVANYTGRAYEENYVMINIRGDKSYIGNAELPFVFIKMNN